jgi:hypothetical protein
LNYVFGKINLSVLIPVDSEEETLGVLQANYKANPETMIDWKLVGIDSHGNKVKIEVCDCVDVDLTEFVG